MHKTVWKPRNEIEHAFKDVNAVTILSCSMCANLSGTGGAVGIKTLKGILDPLKVKVVKSECVLTCCEENIMRQAMDRCGKAFSRSDALVVLSCAGGVKSAFLADRPIRVISPLNSMGSVPVSQADNPITRTICVSCGDCVISHTGGICPTVECPTGTKYGPCDNAPGTGNASGADNAPGTGTNTDADTRCVTSPEIDCIWVQIRERASSENLKDLERLESVHRENDTAEKQGALNLLTSPPKSHAPSLPKIRNILGWFGARIRSVEKLVAIFRVY